MKIAQIAGFLVPVNPQMIGTPNSIPMMAYLLSEELVRRRHEVTIFTLKDSRTHAKVQGIHTSDELRRRRISAATATTPRFWKAYNAYLEFCARHLQGFDVIHNHDLGLIEYADRLDAPFITTLHGRGNNITARQRRSHRNRFVAISHRQQQNRPFLPFLRVIHHGLPLDQFPFQPQPRKEFVWLGRIAPIKGAMEVVELARRCPEYSFTMAGNISAADRNTPYTQAIRSAVQKLRNLRYLGEVNFKEKIRLLGNAKAVLMPIRWEEPFGVVSVEAMACGTPVVGFRKGALPEIIQHGKTGFLARDLRQMKNFLDRVDSLKRQDCRQRAERYFSIQRMADDYEKLYLQLSKHR